MDQRDAIKAVVHAAFKEKDRWVILTRGKVTMVIEGYRDVTEKVELVRQEFPTDREARQFVWDQVMHKAMAAWKSIT